MENENRNAVSLGPNATIGIVGGGQLARMLAVSAAKLGFQTVVLEPAAGCPAAQVCNRQIVAAYDDEAALADLVKASDVVTYEFENVPLSAAHYLEERIALFPPARALEVAQDREVEKLFLQKCGVAVAPFQSVDSPEELSHALKAFGGGILKTRRFGYDGKGQHAFGKADTFDISALHMIWDNLGSAAAHGCVLESFIDFDFEFSVIGARSQEGAFVAYEPSGNEHESGILRRSVVPAAGLAEDLKARAMNAVRTILDELDYVGVIGVEFFATRDGLLVNEIAPRVHNTGHWTAEACLTSQFEQHMRAVAGLPFGSPDMMCAGCEMENLLGHEADDPAALLADVRNHLTLYGKAEAREGRKMGHITRLTLG